MSDVTAEKSALPIVQARRTLLIGLGTTGVRACGQIMDRLTWDYDTPENVPWVRCILLETAELSQKQKAQLPKNVQSIPITIKKADYATLIANPKSFDATMGLTAWFVEPRRDDAPVEAIKTGDAFTDSIENGANNKRILGRLALLYTANFTRTVNAITAQLSYLTSLKEKDASEAFSRTGEQVQVKLSEPIYVYVIGTLAGGTSSGSFIDLGYILQNLPGYGSIRTTGLFLIPSDAHENPRHTANTYAALTELNHFSTNRVRYQQQFPPPLGLVRMPTGSRPYEYLYLLQARGARPVEYARLVTATADYLYSDVIGGTADERDKIRTNIADYFDLPDNCGVTQKFFTFGIGSLEFPYTKVAKACSLRLANRGFEALLGKKTLEPAMLDTLLKDIRLLRLSELRNRLLLRSDAQSPLEGDIASVLSASATSPAALSNAQSQIEAAFSDNRQLQTHNRLPADIVSATVQGNRRQVQEELHTALKRAITGFLVGSDPRGVNDLLAFLKKVEETLQTGIKQSQSLQEDASLMTKARNTLRQAEECDKDLLLGITLGKGAAVRRYLKESVGRYTDYYRTRLDGACAADCTRILNECLQFVQAVHRRIGQDTEQDATAASQVSLKRELERLRDRTKALAESFDAPYGVSEDGTSRVINGVELFEPGKTIPEEYEASLRQRAHADNLSGELPAWERRYALDALQEYAQEAVRALFENATVATRFDDSGRDEIPEYDEYQLLEVARPARRHFHRLKERSVLDRLLSRKDKLPEWLGTVSEASRLFLNWSEGHPRHEPATNKAYKFVFCKDNEPRAEEFKAEVEGAHILDRQGGISFMNDRHHILVVNERGAFSLGTVQELRDDLPENQVSRWRSGYNLSYHARGDVREWVTWACVDAEDHKTLRTLFLVGVALGVIEQMSATRYLFRYRANRLGETGTVTAEFSNDLNLAVQEIRARNIRANLSQEIKNYRSSNGATDVFVRLVNFVQDSDQTFREGDYPLTEDDVRHYIAAYIREDTELKGRYDAAYPNETENQYLGKDAQGQPAYYCPCRKHRFLGRSARDLYKQVTREGRVVEEMRCAFCDLKLN